MKTKIIKTILPTIFGILTVLGLLAIFNLIVYNGDAFTQPDDGFLKFFVPITTIVAMLIQFTLTLPLWKKFKTEKKVLRLTLKQFTGLMCLVSGLAFGLIFWETNLGLNELIALSITGIIAFTVYWTLNLLTLKKLDNTLE